MSLGASVAAGTGWMVGLRWVNRFIGVISVAVTARLLSPADFGLVAMATLVVGFTDAWMQWGLDNALIQSRRSSRDLFDTAWTIRLLQGIVVALLLIALAGSAAAYFREYRVELVMWALAPGLALAAASNIGVVMFRKDLDFRSEFLLQFAPRVIQVSVGIAAAYLLRNYWALVVGLLAGYAAGFVVSYVMHPFRPRWSLASWRELWSFSAWTFAGNVGYYAETKADELIVGRVGTAHDLGLYATASDLGQSASFEMAAPIGRVLFPAFSKIQDDANRLSAGFVRSYEALATFILPAGIGLALVANDAVAVLLGDKWVGAVPLIVVFSIYGIVRSASTPTTSLLLAAGRVKVASGLAWLGLCLFLPLALLLSPRFGIQGIAAARVVAAMVTSVAALALIRQIIPLRISDILAVLFRVSTAVGVMALTVLSLRNLELGPALNLGAKVLAGTVTYASTLLVLWVARGRPDGIERKVYVYVSARVRKLRSVRSP